MTASAPACEFAPNLDPRSAQCKYRKCRNFRNFAGVPSGASWDPAALERFQAETATFGKLGEGPHFDANSQPVPALRRLELQRLGDSDVNGV
jgi:hypothetical protein